MLDDISSSLKSWYEYIFLALAGLGGAAGGFFKGRAQKERGITMTEAPQEAYNGWQARFEENVRRLEHASQAQNERVNDLEQATAVMQAIGNRIEASVAALSTRSEEQGRIQSSILTALEGIRRELRPPGRGLH